MVQVQSNKSLIQTLNASPGRRQDGTDLRPRPWKSPRPPPTWVTTLILAFLIPWFPAFGFCTAAFFTWAGLLRNRLPAFTSVICLLSIYWIPGPCGSQVTKRTLPGSLVGLSFSERKVSQGGVRTAGGMWDSCPLIFMASPREEPRGEEKMAQRPETDQAWDQKVNSLKLQGFVLWSGLQLDWLFYLPLWLHWLHSVFPEEICDFLWPSQIYIGIEVQISHLCEYGYNDSFTRSSSHKPHWLI